MGLPRGARCAGASPNPTMPPLEMPGQGRAGDGVAPAQRGYWGLCGANNARPRDVTNRERGAGVLGALRRGRRRALRASGYNHCMRCASFFCVVVVGFFCGCPEEEVICSPKDKADVERLASFVDVKCDVDINGTDLKNLDALQGLRSANSINITNNIELTDIELGLSGLQSVLAISLSGNPGVTQLVFDGDVNNVNVSGNNVDVIDLAHITGGLGVTNERATTVQLHDSPVFQLNLFEVTSFESFDGIDGGALSALTIHNAPVLLQADVDAFLAGIDPPPSIVQVCGTVGGAACE